MPLPAGIARVNVNANLIDGEEMVHTLHFRNLLSGAYANTADEAQGIADITRNLWATFFQDPAGPLSTWVTSSTTYTDVTAYVLDAAARAQSQATATFTTNLVGSAQSSLPLQIAMCVSLSSTLAGRRGKGRLYLGGLGTTSTAQNARFNTDVTSGVAESFSNFVFSMASNGHQLVVASKTAGVVSDVNLVRVGDVPDVQRRRRESLRETYFGAPVAPRIT